MTILPPAGGEGREGGGSAHAPCAECAGPPPSPALPPRGGKGEHRYTRHAGALAKRLRKSVTYTEKLLWAELRQLPLHVRKQSPVGRYVGDFVIHAAKLVVEVDGTRHELDDALLHDAERDAWLRAEGFEILRFTDRQVIADAATLAAQVLAVARSRLLPPAGGEGREGGRSANASPAAYADRPPSPALLPRGGKGE